jgi:CheY-like chemotaxis protein
MNLAINAAEAIGTAAGTVTIRTFARETESEQQVVLEVLDSGCGMDEATRARIFDPFFSTKFTGRGLGLSAVLGIVRGHRGFISVESAAGSGSVFTVVLPAVPAAEVSAPLEMRTELRGYGHLLVVDDEELVRTMARFTLERCGYTVEMASGGDAALRVFGGRPRAFDAVLLDLTMPGMNGEEVMTRMRAVDPGVCVILSSGFGESEAIHRSGAGSQGKRGAAARRQHGRPAAVNARQFSARWAGDLVPLRIAPAKRRAAMKANASCFETSGCS